MLLWVCPISNFIFIHYYCLFFESSDDVAWADFVVVSGKTLINAVCANLTRWGGVITFAGQ